MSRSNETPLLIVSFVITSAIIAAGGWWFFNRSQPPVETTETTPPPTSTTTPPVETTEPTPPPTNTTTPPVETTETTPPPTSTTTPTFPLANTVPSETIVRINGSTSMVQINEIFKKAFMEKFPGTQVIANASGTEKGIEDVINGQVDLAAISRTLTPAEQQQGLVAIPVATDSVAVIAEVDNPVSNLTTEQVKQIFQGDITNWSQVGGANRPIRVINRPPISGTHQFFQEAALNGQNFGNTSNITTMERDATTPIIRSLDSDGISYATYSQVVNQSTVRVLSINELNPTDSSYPYTRTLYYAYKQPPNAEVQAFLGYLQSPEGQANF